MTLVPLQAGCTLLNVFPQGWGSFSEGEFHYSFFQKASLALFFWFCSDRAPSCWVCIIDVTQQLQQSPADFVQCKLFPNRFFQNFLLRLKPSFGPAVYGTFQIKMLLWHQNCCHSIFLSRRRVSRRKLCVFSGVTCRCVCEGKGLIQSHEASEGWRLRWRR